jgi:hypothetical protein
MKIQMRSIIHILISIGIFLTLSDCAMPPKAYSRPYDLPPPPSEEAMKQLGTVGIVPARFLPEYTFDTFGKGRFSGAGKGAAAGTAAGAIDGLYMTGATALTFPPLAALFLPIFVATGAAIGAVAGGVVGTVNAVSGAKAEEIDTLIRNALAELKIQETMAGHIMQAGQNIPENRFEVVSGYGPVNDNERPDYRFLKEKDMSAVLEVKVNKLGFEGGRGSDPEITFFMNVQARLIQVPDGIEIYSGIFEHKSKHLKVSTWADNDAQLLREEVEQSYRDLAGRIMEELFLFVDFPLSYWSPHQICMLSPIYPENSYNFFKANIALEKVDTLQPTFQWESFPRERDKEADKAGLLNRINDITYDFKVLKAADNCPLQLVYERRELTDSRHKIEQPLEPSTKYFWSVRARFKLDGKVRATKWSYSRKPWVSRLNMGWAMVTPSPLWPIFQPPIDPCKINYIPEHNYFRFITPSQ